MDTLALIPNADAIPVAWWWFEGLNLLTFVIHIIMVNAVVGGGLFALYLWFSDRTDPLAGALAGKLPVFFALMVNFGVAPLLFLQVLYGQFFYTSAVMSAVWWLSIVGLLILGYYSLYIHQHRLKKDGSRIPLFLGLGMLLALCVSLVLTSVLSLMERPDQWLEYFGNARGTVLGLFHAEAAPRYLHFLFSSLAVGGLAAALLAGWDKRLQGDSADKARIVGMKLFATATLLQMATGLWWLISLERDVMLQFMGDNALATGLFVVAVGLTLPALSAGFRGKPKEAAVWTLITITAMVCVRAMLRSFKLAPYFSPKNLTVNLEFSPLLLFLITLVLGLVIVAYMLRLAFRTQGEG